MKNIEKLIKSLLLLVIMFAFTCANPTFAPSTELSDLFSIVLFETLVELNPVM